MPDSNETIHLLKELISVESVNPDLVPGGSGEARMASLIAELMRGYDLEVAIEEALPGRPNVIGVLHGSGGGPSLMLNGHLDTVGVEGMEAPFVPRESGGRMYGRGAQDMKGGLAAALLAVAELAREPRLKGDVMIAAVADEEWQSAGTRALLNKHRTDAAIVLEPTGLEIVVAHKGFAWAEVETTGRAAHGSLPREGRDAITMMGRLLVEIEGLQKKLESAPGHSLLGHGSVHASLIQGGQEMSSYPQSCRVNLERRLIPGEGAKALEIELDFMIFRLKSKDSSFDAAFRVGYSATPFETQRDAPIVRALAQSARQVLGARMRFGHVHYWTDAALLQDAGISSVVFGPGGAGMHSTEEYVVVEEVEQCARILADCARGFCGLQT